MPFFLCRKILRHKGNLLDTYPDMLKPRKGGMRNEKLF